MYPDFAFEIVSEEVYNYYFLITFLHNDKKFYFRKMDSGDLEISLEKSRGMQLDNYADVKEYTKLIHASGYFSNNKTEAELVII
jgi:hypothetical protein